MVRRRRSEVVKVFLISLLYICKFSVGDPDPDLQDPHVFGPPGSGSGSISQRYRIRILPFSHKGVEWTEIILV